MTPSPSPSEPPSRVKEQEVLVSSRGTELVGTLGLPETTVGLVLFAHGSGSGRLSPRNRWVARALQERGLGTLLFDLLTEQEAGDRSEVFDIDLLAERLMGATHWCLKQPALSDVAPGFFGASTGAAAALLASGELGSMIRAIVSRGGRPDLVGDRLSHVTSPTLLIVGGADEVVLGLNQRAFAELGSPKRLEVVPGAGHLFEQPGALERVAQLSGAWFVHYLSP